MVDIELKEAFPLCWPAGFAKTNSQERARFKSTSGFGVIRDRLLHELSLMGAREVILSTNIPVRNDGLPYAKYAEPWDSGVAVYFKQDGKDAVLACDKWKRVQHNVHALALTVEAMRGLDRWGASEILARVFTGFAALPAPREAMRSWREVFRYQASYTPTRAELDSDYRMLAKILHPDMAEGSAAAFAELQSAYETGKAVVK